jgi:hypothetical protein
VTRPCTTPRRLTHAGAAHGHQHGTAYLPREQPRQQASAPSPLHAVTPATPARTAARRANKDRAAGWLRGAMLALAVLAGAAAVVSWDAQYVLVRAVKHNPAVAGLEAGIPDIGAVIFAALGIALALHGKRALRARALNLACVGISLAMNALASAPGWPDLAIWIMPSAVYALASDTLIGVIRVWVTARARDTGHALGDDEATPIAVIGATILWLVRLSLAPFSTIAGFRRWVIDECPVAPGRKAASQARITRQRHPAIAPPPLPAQPPPNPTRRIRPGKQARLLALASQRHDLGSVPLNQVSKIATAIAAEVDLAPGTARRVLLAHVRELQNAQPARQEATS